MRIQFESLQELFSTDSAVPKNLMKGPILADFRLKELVGIPENHLQITFQPVDGGDILVRQVDPENAQGYRTYENESDYFNQLKLDLFTPTDSDFAAGGANV